jgi:tRNA dimethylallyltransferase
VALSSAFCTALAKVVICAGPTASGKSAYALKLAQEQGGVIINGDSLQVYRKLEILTAQPSGEDQQTVPHYLYGCLDPAESCSAGYWLSLVLPIIQQAHKNNQVPIVVGGTGFYLRTLLVGVSPIPPTDPEVRKKLLERNESQEVLYKELQGVDPEWSSHINPHDHQRTMRGLEVYYGTGKPLSFWHAQKPSPPPYDFEKVLLLPEKETLDHSIQLRIEDMLKKGVLDEVAHALTLPLSETAKKAIGLREFGDYLKGNCSLEQAKELTFIHTCQYAKRQRTWFRGQFE